MYRWLLVPLALLSVLYANIAGAALIVYTDRVSWEGAIGSFSTEDFESAPLGQLSAGTTDLGLVDFTFDTGPSNLGPAIVGPSVSNSVNGSRQLDGHIFTLNQGGGGTTTPSYHEFDFGALVFGWGADFRNTLTGDDLIATTAGIDTLFSDHLTGIGNGFLGVISDTAFSSFRLTTADASGFSLAEFFWMDDLSFSTSIPEPTSLALLIAGLAGLGCLRRRAS